MTTRESMSHEDRREARDERAPGPRSAVHAFRATAGQRVMNDERPMVTEGRSTVKEPAVTDEVLRGMRVMVEAFRQVSGALSLQETLEAILDGLRALLAYDAAGLYVSDPETGRLKHYAVRGYAAGVSQTELVSKGERLLRRVMDAGAPMLIADVASDRRYIEARASTRSEIAVPIMGSGGRVIGLLNLESDRKDTYDPLSLELVRVFASGVAAAIERAILHAEMMAARRLETELAIARSVMEGILPPTTPRWEGFDVAVVHEPWRQVGGDYYDFIPVDRERWALAIADVAGKGVPAALLVSALWASLHSLTRNELAVRSVINKVNRFFHESWREGGRLVTLFFAELDIRARQLLYINAGHPPALLLRQGGDGEVLSSGGPPLGPLETPHYLEGLVHLEAGDVLAVYTDGITEAMNAADEEYGQDRLSRVLRERRAESASQIARAVMEDVDRFSRSRRSDDRTLVIIKAL